MLSWLRPLWYEVFPFWLQSNAERYGQEAASNPDFAANTTALQARIPDMGRNEVDLIHAYAKGRMDAEAARANSVLSRAQALLVAQAFLGALLSLGGTVVGHLEAFSFWRSSLLGIVALYLVIQTVLLTVSALRALSGVPFPAIGSSDLLAMLSSPADDIVRQMTLQMLLHYRTAANLNTWRFSHFEQRADRLAQHCDRTRRSGGVHPGAERVRGAETAGAGTGGEAAAVRNRGGGGGAVTAVRSRAQHRSRLNSRSLNRTSAD